VGDVFADQQINQFVGDGRFGVVMGLNHGVSSCDAFTLGCDASARRMGRSLGTAVSPTLRKTRVKIFFGYL